jgi:hypothetical protein
MHRWVIVLLAIALVVAVGVSTYRQQQRNQPRPGDTVTPVLASGSHWLAGQPATLAVRLQARAGEEEPRLLNFIAGVSANPTATVTFFSGEQPYGPSREVPLSHRC